MPPMRSKAAAPRRPDAYSRFEPAPYPASGSDAGGSAALPTSFPGWPTDVAVGCGSRVEVAVLAGALVAVAGACDVAVGGTGVSVGADGAVAVGVEVAPGTPVGVEVGVLVGTGVFVGVGVSVGIGVLVGVSVGVDVGVAVGAFGGSPCTVTGVLLFVFVPSPSWPELL